MYVLFISIIYKKQNNTFTRYQKFLIISFLE